MSPFISLCMITKNEQRVLERCLKSVEGLVDEIIIVDTGSTDATKEIAYTFTPHVYDFTWTNDFAAARNVSIRKATGTWILVLDADEYIEDADKQNVKETLLTLDPAKPVALLLPIINFTGKSESEVSGIVESSAPRVFPYHEEIYYTNPIHEQITHKHGRLTFVNHSMRIYHTGYLDDVVAYKKKAERNFQIFEDIRSSNKKLNSFELFTLAKEYLNAKDYKKALYYYKRAYDRSKSDALWLPHCIDDMLSVYFNLRMFKEAFELVHRWLPRLSNYVDYHYWLGTIYNHFGYYDEAAAKFEDCIRIAEAAEQRKQPFSLVKPDYGYLLPYQNLFRIYKLKRNWPKVVFSLTKLLQINPNQHQYLIPLADLLQKFEPVDQIVSLMSKLYPLSRKENALLMLRIFTWIGNKELSAHYYELCEQDTIFDTVRLRYELVQNNPEQFKTTIRNKRKETSSITEDNLFFLRVAAFAWNDRAYLSLTDTDEVQRFLLNIYDGKIPNAYSPNELAVLTRIATELLKLGYLEAYDTLINTVSHPLMINGVGDYFFANEQIELALDYYSLLLKEEQLGAKGYENLARLYLEQGETKDGLEFLRRAIELNPGHIPLYTLYLKHSEDREQAEQIRENLFNHYPQYRGIPILQK